MTGHIRDTLRVLVVGTTSDYIRYLHNKVPGRAVFLTDPAERAAHPRMAPAAEEEILCPLDDDGAVITTVLRHKELHGYHISGITCFDCESMGLTARVAAELSLPFHTPQAVALTRSKFHAKERWQAAGLDCPRAALVRSVPEVLKFWRRTGGNIVIKPLTGSGSEFVYHCRDEQSCITAMAVLQTRVPAHPNRRMYSLERLPDNVPAARVFCAESFVGGTEYSCDAMISNGELRIVRLTRKCPLTDEEFGMTMAYQMLNAYPPQLSERYLCAVLKAATRSLGLYHAWIMADFKVDRDRIFLLEITPRPGGDCLPMVVAAAGGPDILVSMLNFAVNQRVPLPLLTAYRPVAGMLLYATQAGRIRSLEISADSVKSEILEVQFNRRRGDLVRMPPEDYDSRRLGYVIFNPCAHRPLEAQCREIRKALKVEMEEPIEATR